MFRQARREDMCITRHGTLYSLVICSISYNVVQHSNVQSTSQGRWRLAYFCHGAEPWRGVSSPISQWKMSHCRTIILYCDNVLPKSTVIL